MLILDEMSDEIRLTLFSGGLNLTPCVTCRVKIFRGRKVHGEYDIKVEQVGFTDATICCVCVHLCSPVTGGEFIFQNKSHHRLLVA